MSTAAFLTDRDIKALASAGHPLVEPYDPDVVEPASVDLRLSGEAFSYELTSYRLGDDIADSDWQKSQFEQHVMEPQDTVHVGVDGRITIPDDALGFDVSP